MKILHISFMYPSQNKPNHGLAIERLVLGLQKQDSTLQQTVLHTDYYAASPIITENLNGINLIRIKIQRWKRYFPFFNPPLTNWIGDINTFDVIHFHNLFPGVFLFQNFLKKCPIPYVISLRGTCYGVIKKTYRRKFIIQALKNAHKIIYISGYYKQLILEELKDDYSQKSILLPNPIPDYFGDNIPQIKPSTDEGVKILIISGIEKRKNLYNTLSALKDFACNKNIEINLYGAIYDSKEYQRIAPLIDNQQIFYSGEVKSQSIPALLDEHHLLVLCAFEETFGLVYAEAITRKTPVIYTANSGFASFVEEKRIGICIQDVSNKQEIIEALKKVTAQLNSFKFYEPQLFLEQNVVKQYQAIYKQIVNP